MCARDLPVMSPKLLLDRIAPPIAYSVTLHDLTITYSVNPDPVGTALDMTQHGVHLACDFVVAGNQNVGVRSRRIHVLPGHGRNHRPVLLQHARARASAFAHVALDAPLQTKLLVEIDKDFGAEQCTQAFPVQREESLANDERPRSEFHGFRGAPVAGEVINRKCDRFAIVQLARMPQEQLGIQSFGRVKIVLRALLQAEVIQLAIVGVEGK
jgi:hypothetical protein